MFGIGPNAMSSDSVSTNEYSYVKDAAFLLTVGSFLLTVELSTYS